MQIKTKIWLENDEGKLILGSGRAQILKTLQNSKSIKFAAKKLDMNYRKCWGKLNDINENFGKNLIISKAGKTDGGTHLSDDCLEILQKFEILQNDIKDYAKKRFNEIFTQNS